jgi:hypothetical protein
MLCIEQNDEWLVGRAYLSAESMHAVLALSERNSQDPQIQKRRNIPKDDKEGTTPAGLSRQRPHRRGQRSLLHHVQGLDSRLLLLPAKQAPRERGGLLVSMHRDSAVSAPPAAAPACAFASRHVRGRARSE